MGATWNARARLAMAEWQSQRVTDAERAAFEAGKVAQIAALEQPLRDAVAAAVNAGEQARQAQASVDAALRGDAERAGER
jgi:hypothetical protein